jgi:type IX secretion system PorP/SprF family membrane protein
MLLLSGNVMGQQEPLYTQYMYNTVSVNPAYAGTRNALNTLLLSRMQWVGLEGAPRTYTFSAHAPLENYKMGVGLSIVSDRIGPVSNTYFNLNYAYRVKVNKELILSMGIKAGIYNFYAGLKDVFLANPNQVDGSFYSNASKRFQPNAGVGFYLYNKRFYAGFSIPKLIQSNIGEYEYEGTVLSDLKRHYYVMAGYVFNINQDIVCKPAFIEKVVEGALPSTDISAQFIYRGTYCLGTSWRIGDAVAFIANVQVNKQLSVGYSYDFSTSHLASYNHGSHEIMISCDFDSFINNKSRSNQLSDPYMIESQSKGYSNSFHRRRRR